ncbi:hypothetical protein E6C27_scaffold69G00170 [Cucumis melo var. makuwa]|uniref:Uncharacterized protein n=1 Tax=Cucumis melo var. makuwa TaxID=1194695 RepID=A0A5A7SYL4_CUCMM|nr:hypothetical protein E6C27_scaffold69G00170 [Cucumis melo var. makuwa]
MDASGFLFASAMYFLHRSSAAASSIFYLFSASRNNISVGRLCPYRKWHPLLRVPSSAAPKTRAKQQTVAVVAALNFRPLSRAAKDSRSRCIKDLTLKFSGPTASSFGDSSLYSGNVTASCSLYDIGCKELFTDRHRCSDVLYIVVMLMGYVVDWNCMSMDFKFLRLGVSFGITRLICASFGITRLIRASFGITRLISVSFGVTRLIRASFGITRLMYKDTARGRSTRGRRMREGHMDVKVACEEDRRGEEGFVNAIRGCLI